MRIHAIVWRIFGYSNIFEYFPIRIFVRIIFVSFFWYEYIRIFVRMLFLDTNIFVYSFVSFFWYEYIRIFVRMVFNIRIYLCQLKLLFGINQNKFTPHSLGPSFCTKFQLQEAESGLPSTGVKCFQTAAWPAEGAILNSYTWIMKIMYGSQPKKLTCKKSKSKLDFHTPFDAKKKIFPFFCQLHF